jgi:6-methylsalicylate decarboxylase
MKTEDRARIAPESAQRELNRQFYDLASIGLNPAGLAGLRKMIPITQLLYGSDEPFTSTVQTMKTLMAEELPGQDWQLIRRENALVLFPHLRS